MAVGVGLSHITVTEQHPNVNVRVDRNVYRPTVPQGSIAQESQVLASIERTKERIEQDELTLAQYRQRYEFEQESQSEDMKSGVGIAPNRLDTQATNKAAIEQLEFAIQGHKENIKEFEAQLETIRSARPVLPPIEDCPEFTLSLV